MTASQAMEAVRYFFERTPRADDYCVEREERHGILSDFLAAYSYQDDAQVWFEKVKDIAGKHGFATDMKEYKLSPESFKGSVADVAEVLRIATTGRANTPDLWSIMQILGENEVHARLEKAKDE